LEKLPVVIVYPRSSREPILAPVIRHPPNQASALVVPPALRRQIGLEHGDIIAAALGPLANGRDMAMPQERFCFICFTNRCGSNYLAQLLAATCRLGEAGEVFNAGTVLEHAFGLPAPSLRAYVAHLPNLVGVCGWVAAKASIDQLMMLTEAGILQELLPRSKFILLERRDRLGQAISRCIAGQNAQWTTEHPSRLPDSDLVYSRAAIDAELGRIELATYGFYSFFAGNQLSPLHLLYEDLVADPDGVVARTGDFLGIPDMRIDPARVRLRRQANAINESWRARYESGG
jgi:LPS sulfotransferase NodH